MTTQFTIEKHPELKLAHQLTGLFKGSVIAGGCPRDLILKRPIKDIDIFIPAGFSKGKTIADVAIALTQLTDAEIIVEEEYFEECQMLARLRTGLLDVCVMEFGSTEYLVERFDNTISQVWLERVEDGFNVNSFELFHLHQKNIIGYYPVFGDSMSIHTQRILEKFPDYQALPLVRMDETQPVKNNDSCDCGWDIPF